SLAVDHAEHAIRVGLCAAHAQLIFFFKQKTAYEIGLGIPAEPLFRSRWQQRKPYELNQDDARYGFRCCHLKNIWTAPLPPETERSEERRVGKECRSRGVA